MEYCIWEADASDQKTLIILMKEHALYEGHELKLSIQKQQFNKLETLPLTLFVVESNKTLVGYMSAIKQFSTWDMDWYLFLDCLLS